MSITLTGTFTRLDGDPATGTVKITPSRSPIMDSTGKVIISGPQTFPLDKDGKLTFQIPASNDPDLGPAFTYTVEALLSHNPWKISKVWIPHGSSTVDLSEIGDYTPTPGVATRVVTIPADGTDGQVLVWDGAGFSWDFPPEGPQGPPGEVTTAALTTALAGKVTGTGMSVRFDNSVGTRVLLDHPGGTTMLHGDTGWRNVESLLDPDFVPATVAGRALVRRVNNQVFWTIRVRLVEPRPIATPQNLTTTIPVQFRQSPIVYGSVGMGLSFPGRTAFSIENISSSEVLLIRGAGTGEWSVDENLSASFSYSTAASWPTTLPGLPG